MLNVTSRQVLHFLVPVFILTAEPVPLTLGSPFLFRKEMGKSPALRIRSEAGSRKAEKSSEIATRVIVRPPSSRNSGAERDSVVFRCRSMCTGIKPSWLSSHPGQPAISGARRLGQARSTLSTESPRNHRPVGGRLLRAFNFGARMQILLILKSSRAPKSRRAGGRIITRVMISEVLFGHFSRSCPAFWDPARKRDPRSGRFRL